MLQLECPRCRQATIPSHPVPLAQALVTCPACGYQTTFRAVLEWRYRDREDTRAEWDES
jgi:hypothetical protein